MTIQEAMMLKEKLYEKGFIDEEILEMLKEKWRLMI